ncbi:MAG: sulfatase [Paludibacter sp.]|nr:sulfatase [Paludibacter sp.]
MQNLIKLFSLIGTSSVSLSVVAAQQQLPNIVFFLIDDLGWKDLGCYGSDYYETPNIDKLATEGMMFTSAYAMPTSSPSRASLMTGKYPPKTGIYAVDGYAETPLAMQKVIGIKSARFISSGETTIAEVLKQAGYTNGHFGKWHLGNTPETYPLNQGFDMNVAGCEAGSPKSYFAPYGNIKNIDPQINGTYLTDVLENEALKFVEANQNKPFFLYFPFYEVHVPLQAKKEWFEKYNSKKQGYNGQNVPEYAAMISYTDHCIGKIIDKLNELNLTNNTLIIISSDNGGQIVATSNSPLKGQKGNLYEGGIRVPLIVKWPGKVKPGSEIDVPVSVVDFYPTFASIAGMKTNEDNNLDGKDLLPLLLQKGTFKRETLFWHLPNYNGNGKSNSKLWQFPGGAIRKGEWKLIENFEDGSIELFNLVSDIGETKNVAQLYPKKKEELFNDLKNWQKINKAPIPFKVNADFDQKARTWTSENNVRNEKELERIKSVR